MLIDYDDPHTWEESLSQALEKVVPAASRLVVATSCHEYVEDACNRLTENVDKKAVAVAVLDWLKQHTLAAHHGTRVTHEECEEIVKYGLFPLKATDRSKRLVRALGNHPQWGNVKDKLNAAIFMYGPQEVCGRREKQAHLTLSKGALTEYFNHYLTHGAEIDGHIAQELLGNDGRELMAQDGNALIFTFGVPGTKAIEATHPYLTPSDMLNRGDFPNLVGEFFGIWCYRLSNPHYSPAKHGVDCGLVFDSIVPPEWLVEYEAWKP